MLRLERSEWKVCLEAVLLEARRGELAAAIETVDQALEQHPATGRLWAARVYLKHTSDASTALAAFHGAVHVVPKSGEVWCEGGRLFANPALPEFDLAWARRCLTFAVHLTPQYGDTFLELLRIQVLERLETVVLGVGTARGSLAELVDRAEASLRLEDIVPSDDDLALLCANADPNYGFLWFWCREEEEWPATDVLAAMKARVLTDLHDRSVLRQYIAAILKRAGLGDASDSGLFDDLALPHHDPSRFAFGSTELSARFLELHKGEADEQWRLLFGTDLLGL